MNVHFVNFGLIYSKREDKDPYEVERGHPSTGQSVAWLQVDRKWTSSHTHAPTSGSPKHQDGAAGQNSKIEEALIRDRIVIGCTADSLTVAGIKIWPLSERREVPMLASPRFSDNLLCVLCSLKQQRRRRFLFTDGAVVAH